MRFVAPRIAAALMKAGLLPAFWLAFSLLVMMLFIIPSVVETVRPPPHRASSGDYQPISESDNLEITSEAIQFSSRDSDEQAASPRMASRVGTEEIISPDVTEVSIQKQAIEYLCTKLRDLMALFRLSNARFCLVAVYLKRIGFASSGFAFQYVSERFGWQLHETTWLRVISGGGAIAIGILAPTVTTQLVHRGTYPPIVDLQAIRAALSILSVSFFAAWKATSDLVIILCTVYLQSY